MTSFSKEELAVQSIVNGQADLGVGTPYSVIQKSKVPLTVVFQMYRLVFFPVASIEYKTWKALDGQPFTFHARGPGTEATGTLIPQRDALYSAPRSYVTGSANRITPMLIAPSHAAVLDLANHNTLLKMGAGKSSV